MTSTRVPELMACAKEAIAKEDWRRARLFLEELTHLLPNEPAMAYNRGLVYFKLGEVESAETWLARAVELKPDYEQASRALAYLRGLHAPATEEAPITPEVLATPPPPPPAAPLPTPAAPVATIVRAPQVAVEEGDDPVWFAGGFWPRQDDLEA